MSRRDVATRKITLFHKLASFLVKLGLKPNHVSIASSAFGLIGGFLFYKSFGADFGWRILFLVSATICIQCRLICNLIDGLMAVECGLKTASGELFNDVPDRVSDVFFILGAGCFACSYSPLMIHVAWLAALAAVLTAYARVLVATMTAQHDFSGPMAKQHRMFLLSLGALGGVVEAALGAPAYTMSLVLILIALGSLWTTWRRLRQGYLIIEKKI